ncbi:MAG TPA: phosphoribosylglycinamide formyltransferase [Steroidobacteraceae bacterium]|jgi:phosphoribosylglycinamide formyltransferase-1
MQRQVVILISGRGSNMRSLIEHSRDPGAPYTVCRVFSDKSDAAGLELARGLGVPAQALPAAKTTDRAAYDRALAAAIQVYSPSLIVLAGFMRILSARFVRDFAGKILNIHPSLLPKFPGLHTHRRALEAHEPEHGATVHFVTERLDCGPGIIQARVAVAADDDEASLAARVQALEHRIYPVAVRWFCEGRLRYDAGCAWLDGRLLREPVQFSGAER